DASFLPAPIAFLPAKVIPAPPCPRLAAGGLISPTPARCGRNGGGICDWSFSAHLPCPRPETAQCLPARTSCRQFPLPGVRARRSGSLAYPSLQFPFQRAAIPLAGASLVPGAVHQFL